MPLPKIDQPIFPVVIPSTGQKTKFRPFTVKEEKILLIAKESKEPDQIVLAMKQVINNCLQNVDVDTLATFDVEYLLLQIRSKSVGETINFTINDPDTGEEVKLSIDIGDVKIDKKEGHTNVIDINETMKIVMGYPKIDKILSLIDNGSESKNTKVFNTMIDCIVSLVDGDDVYKMEDFTQQEIYEFADSLSSNNIKDIKNFFDTMPTIRHEKKYKTSDNKEKTFVLEGTETFFI